jgi:hypothetical protein
MVTRVSAVARAFILQSSMLAQSLFRVEPTPGGKIRVFVRFFPLSATAAAFRLRKSRASSLHLWAIEG